VKKRILFTGNISEAAEEVKKIYQENPHQWPSKTDAAREFFNTHEFAKKKGKKYTFKSFMESVKKA
jgi:hypothetical protein